MAAGVDLTVWPEAAWPGYLPLGLEDPHFQGLDELSVPEQAWHLIGLTSAFTSDGQLGLYNSAYLLNGQLEVLARYHKTKLVPFGEFSPLQRLFPHWRLVADHIPYYAGRELAPLSFELGTLGVMICYEGAFPEISRMLARQGAQFLVNPTNDAWYGVSSMPYQHLSMYVFRAIESGRWVLRAANSGISAAIDQHGRFVEVLPLNQSGVLLLSLSPSSLETLYLSVGDLLPWLCILACLLGLIIVLWLRLKAFV
jgi:apolipoprotein N-acyltransferase